MERGHGERVGRDTRGNNCYVDGDKKREDNYRQRMLLDNVIAHEPSPVPPEYIVPESDDDSSDSDEEKRQDPYKLIGLPDRERIPLKDIETTQHILNGIHQKSIEAAVSKVARKHAEKRLVEIEWAADILLDEMNKRAFEEDSAIFPHEQQIWKKKSK
jgi:hypothetical protein